MMRIPNDDGSVVRADSIRRALNRARTKLLALYMTTPELLSEKPARDSVTMLARLRTAVRTWGKIYRMRRGGWWSDPQPPGQWEVKR